jgi:hypothetical protein
MGHPVEGVHHACFLLPAQGRDFGRALGVNGRGIAHVVTIRHSSDGVRFPGGLNISVGMGSRSTATVSHVTSTVKVLER